MDTAVLPPDATVHAAPGQLSSRLGSDVVILNVNSGVYYGLDPVGARVWELVQQEASFQSLQQAILSEFDVEPETCRRDLNDLLRDMHAQGLIQLATQHN